MGTLLAILLLQTQAEVEAAVAKGVKVVKGGQGELALWTLLHAGVPEADPDVKRLFDALMTEPPASTTSAALQAMILEEVDRRKHLVRIARCAQQLIDTQCDDGFWDAGRAVEPPDILPPAPKGPRGAGAKPPVLWRYKMVKRAGGGPKGEPELGRWAMWGLLAAYESGLVAPAEVVERAARAWREGGHDAADTLSVLSIRAYLSGKDWKKDPEVLKAVERLKAEKRTAPKEVYGLKVATLHFGSEVSPIDVKAFLAARNPDGGWGDVEATCYGVLTLSFPRRL